MRRTTARAAVLAVLVGLLAILPTAPSVAADPVRIMLLGDSITAGGAGDWTWRYRLWHHLVDQGVPVDLVGPHRGYDGDHEPEYVDLEFDLDHAAIPGMGYATMQPSGTQLATDFRPDVVVVLLGINDLLFWGGTPATVHAGAVELINDVRAVRADTTFVFGLLTPFWAGEIDATNALLDDLPHQMSTPTSPVVVADTGAGWDVATNTFDGLHLSARGEVAVAGAFADALAGVGIGAPPIRPLPVVPNGPRVAPVLEGTAGDGTATLTWRNPPGVGDEVVWVRDVTLATRWAPMPDRATGERLDLELVNGHEYDVMLQPAKGTQVAADDVRSNVVHLAPLAPAPGGISDLFVLQSLHGLGLSWSAPADPPAPTAHRVRWWPVDDPAAVQETVVTDTRQWIGGLVAGREYAVEVAALHDTTPGPATTATGIVGGHQLAAVTGLAPRLRRDGRIRVTWELVPDADHHELQARLPGRAWTTLADLPGRRWTTARYRPGRTVLLRVRGWDGLVPGPFSAVARLRIS